MKRQLQKAVMSKEEGGDDESGYLKSFVRNIVKNLEVTLQDVVSWRHVSHRSTFATRTDFPTPPSLRSAA